MRDESIAPLLEMRGISMRYHTPQGETEALSEISLTVEKGGFLAIVGPSGCGKSTILSLIAGLLRPSSGEIRIAGEPLGDGVSPLVGYMLQHDHLFPWCSVWENVQLGLKLRGQVSREQQTALCGLLEEYGLGEFRNSLPRHLSGGMRQRAALIRTLAVEPELLLLDEPFSALDYQTRIRVSDDIGSIIRSQGKTAVLVTHDISEAISMADQVAVLSARPGRIKFQTPIHLSSPSQSVVDKRKAPEFAGYFDRIWKELNVDA